MKRSSIAAAIVIGGTALVGGTLFATAQTVVPCTSTDPNAAINGTCPPPSTGAPTTSVQTPNIGSTLDQGTFGIDENPTSAVPQQGAAPLVVPNDPLGQGIELNPLGNPSAGSPGGLNSNAVSVPTVQSPSTGSSSGINGNSAISSPTNGTLSIGSSSAITGSSAVSSPTIANPSMGSSSGINGNSAISSPTVRSPSVRSPAIRSRSR